MIQIKQRYTNAIIFTINAPNLRRANLRSANLCDANLCGANLRGADLFGADLNDANLCNANLHGANLCNADLNDANLCGADLFDADLRGADLSGEKLKSNPIFIYGLNWQIVVTNEYLTIGCQRHLITDWREFNDTQIRDMHENALSFWKTYKPMLMQLCTIQAIKMEETLVNGARMDQTDKVTASTA